MFDLDDAIDRWCARVTAGAPMQSDLAAELADHLHVTVAALMNENEGIDANVAFQMAKQRLGESQMLNQEFEKNRSLWSRLCAFDRGVSRLPKAPEIQRVARRLLIGHAILWAAAQLATAWMVADADESKSVAVMIMIPLWFASWLLIMRAMRSLAPSESNA